MLNLGKNIKGEIDPTTGELVLRIDLSKSFGRTSGGSGKNISVATTNGNKPLPFEGFDEFSLGLNLYREPRKGE
jgi:hypothetical protein